MAKNHRIALHFLIGYVVGYQNKVVLDESKGGFTWVLSTLPDVGKSYAELTLASWKVTAPNGGLTSESSVRVNTFDAAGQISGDYCYLDADSNGALYGVKSGWYTADSVAEWDPIAADATIIPFGVGVQIGSDCGATITFAGNVVQGNTDIEIVDESAGGYTWTGNCSPVNLTLADFAITPPEGGLTSESSVRVNTFDAAGQIAGDYCYLDANTNGALYGVESGWYTADSVAAWDPVAAGSTPIASGEMFQIGSDCGATITIPSAL